MKKDRSVKIALDPTALNQAIDKEKYQMPNLENLLDIVAEKLDTEKGEAWFSSVDMTYAYGQVPLHLLTAKHCNFQIFGGESTGTYRFVTGFYGLSVMPTEFQKKMDILLAKVREVFVFIDDILIVTKGTKKEHLDKVREILKTLDQAELQLKARKCVFAKNEIEWLGFKLTENGISPKNTKVQGITEKHRPTNLKELRSFLGAVNQFNEFIPELAVICSPFRFILKKDATWNWNNDHKKAFLKVNSEVKKVAELTHFKRNVPLRIICDASKNGLAAVLQQCEENKWKPISYASRFLNGHIENINEIKDNVFIQPTVITVKKDRSVKIALDLRALNQAIDKDKYQMPNLENLLDMVAEKLDTEKGEAWFSSVDMTYAYGQVPLHLLTAKHCNFQIFGGESTGTYRFVTGFYGLSVMQTEFQKKMDILSAKVIEVLVFIDANCNQGNKERTFR